MAFSPARFRRHAIELCRAVNALGDEVRARDQYGVRYYTGSDMVTIAEQLKAARAQLAEARQGAANAVAESASASGAVLSEVNKVLKEASDLRAEVAELTNGGPPLEDIKPTSLPVVNIIPDTGTVEHITLSSGPIPSTDG